MRIACRETDPSVVISQYFTKAYGAAGVSDPNARWVTLADLSGRWQMPLVLSPLTGGGFEAHSPYGYTGIHVNDELDQATVRECWKASREILVELGVVSLFLRFAPFDLGSVERVQGLPGLSMAHVSDTVSVPTVDPGQIWTEMQGKSRTAIRKAEKLGMVGIVEPASLELLAMGSAFRDLYEGTMRRVGAAAHHFYTDDYYSSLIDGLGDRFQVINVHNAEGSVVASALMLVDDNVVHYHLSGSHPQEARNGANNLLLWTLLQWSSANQRESVHLGGGTSRADSLFKFKASFGGNTLPFFVGKAVMDRGRYEELTRLHAASVCTDAAGLLQGDYFPAFRAPGVAR